MYTGNELPFLPSNILFTVGGAAAVLSTRSPPFFFARSLGVCHSSPIAPTCFRAKGAMRSQAQADLRHHICTPHAPQIIPTRF